jgi:hypothetical protein
MEKLCIFLVSTALAASTLFAMSGVTTLQGQAPTSDLPMTIINETNSSSNTTGESLNSYNTSQMVSQPKL